MATVSKTRYTPEDLLNITDRPMPELIDGELVERPVMGIEADSIAATVLYYIVQFVRANKLGYVNGAQGSYQIFPDDSNKVRIPDVSFTRKDRLASTGLAKGHGRVAPDLAVEVVSPNVSPKDLVAKLQDFRNAGIPLIWVVYPKTRTVQIHRLNGTSTLLNVGDFLEGEEILPGFRVEVAELFA